MDTAALLAVLAIAGVNFGWQPTDDGSTGYEYVVQVEPDLIDALQRGETVPIESNIPPEVSPIRKVRIVVGRGELARSPIRHTANFAGQAAGWTPDRYPPTNTGGATAERYPANSSPNEVSPPPSFLDQAQAAVNETGSTLSNGAQAGVQSASDQISRAGSQIADDTRSAAEGFGRQLQQWGNDAGQQMQATGSNLQNATDQTLDATGNQLRQASNSLGLTGSSPATTNGGNVSAPPWPTSAPATAQSGWPADNAATRGATSDFTAAPGMSMTRTPSGWTSIGTGVAAPPLLNPPMTTALGGNAGVRTATAGNNGPNFPAPPVTAGSNREPLHSVLVDPAQQSALASDWGTNGQASPATIGRNANASNSGSQVGGGLVPVQPVTPTAQDTQQAANRWNDPWGETDPWKQQPNSPPQSMQPPPNGTFANSGQNFPQPTAQPVIGQATNTSGYPANPNPPGGNLPAVQVAGGNQPAAGQPAEQPPWLPLLLVSLSLVGSLSANLFLGWSYIDARQKYRSLVRKTADTFRRVAGAAAA